MSKVDVDSIQLELENGKFARLLEHLNRFISRRVQLDKEEGILRINLEFDYKKSSLFRKLAESMYIELFLILVENSAIKYSVVFSQLANSMFLLSRILGRNINIDTVNIEKWNSIVANFYEVFQIIQNQRRGIAPKNINEVLVSLNKILDIVRNWSSDMYYSKSMLSKL